MSDKPQPYQPSCPVVDKSGFATPAYRMFWNNLVNQAQSYITGVSVAGAGALSGNGTSGSPLAVKVDGTSVVINGSDTLAMRVPIYWGFRSDITDAQFKALPSTFQTIVATPGANLTLIPWWGYIQVNAGTAYTNVDPGSQAGLAIAYGDWDIDALNFLSNWVGTTIGQIITPFVGVPDAAALAAVYPGQNNCWLGEDKPLKLIAWNPSGNYTGGNAGNTIRVGVAYSVLNVQTGVFV